MRTLSRLAPIAAAAATLIAVPAATGATLSASLSPNKGGSITVGAPTTFGLKGAGFTTAYDPAGGTRLKAIKANLPEQLLFNTTGFKLCDVDIFQSSKVCPSATKLGDTSILVDAGPEVGQVTATATLYIGSGFTILARVQADRPAIIDEPIVGELRSSGVKGYGLQMYIPVPSKVQQPIDGVYPVVRGIDATVKPPTRSVKVPGEKKKVKLPLAGLGTCSGALKFQFQAVYTDATGAVDKSTEGAEASAKCKKK